MSLTQQNYGSENY